MSTPLADDDAPDQRLHPWSWLFVLLMQLRQFLLPVDMLGNRRKPNQNLFIPLNLLNGKKGQPR